MHDLLPLPYTRKRIEHVVSRLHEVQDYLRRPILIENVSSYLNYTQSEMTEWEFISDIAKQAGCYILLDVNNIYVSAVNHNFNAMDYINAIPSERVLQIHLAGHSQHDNYIIDTHDAQVSSEVWDLYAQVIKRLGPVSTMIERDDNIPPLFELLAELECAKQITEHIYPKELVL